MNMTTNRQRKARQNRVDFQEVIENANTESVQSVKTFEHGEIRQGTFSINVLSDEKDEKGERKKLYSNDKEPFEYEYVSSFGNMLLHAGAKLDENQLSFLTDALKSEDAETDKTIGSAVKSVLDLYNSNLKANAKSAAYAAIVNRTKPLEGEKKESAQSRMVTTFAKLAQVSIATAIEQLKTTGALPADFTESDMVALRRAKSEDED